MKGDPTSRATRLVRRARARAFRHLAGRALLRGLSVGAVVAAAAAVVARAFGVAPGSWLLAALLPATAVALLGLRRARPTMGRAALLLDRAAGTRERFATTLCAEDEEVRDLVARQAVEARERKDLALSFPPSTEGLVAALATALLVVVLLLASGGGAEDATSGGGSAGPTAPGVPAVAPASASREPAGEPVEGPDPRRAAERLASGADLTEEEWRALEAHGVAPSLLDEARAAAGRGDGEGAAARVREALAGIAARRAETRDPAEAWSGFAEAMEQPGWSPRFDRVVRLYFRRTEEEGHR